MAERGGLISTEELAGLIGQADLRIFDCTTYLDYQPEGSPVPYIARPGTRVNARCSLYAGALMRSTTAATRSR